MSDLRDGIGADLPHERDLAGAIVGELADAVQQLQGQVPSIDRALVEHRAALAEQRQGIVNLDLRLTALQQQTVYFNLRIKALDQAIQAKAICHPDEIVSCADKFFAFLTKLPPGPAVPKATNGAGEPPDG
jgi:hypothetical protein